MATILTGYHRHSNNIDDVIYNVIAGYIVTVNRPITDATWGIGASYLY